MRVISAIINVVPRYVQSFWKYSDIYLHVFLMVHSAYILRNEFRFSFIYGLNIVQTGSSQKQEIRI